MKYLGVDFGLRRLGLAISEGSIASPFKTIEVRGLRDTVNQVSMIVRKHRIEKIIVGLPEGKIGKTALGFINALKKLGFDVESFDETLSTQKALDKMIELGIPRNRRKISDSQAAAIILQEWLDSSNSL